MKDYCLQENMLQERVEMLLESAYFLVRYCEGNVSLNDSKYVAYRGSSVPKIFDLCNQGCGAGAGATRSHTFCPEPEPEPEPL